MKTARTSGMRILLVRHGETEWNRLHRFQGRSDIPLNNTGKNQASALAAALRHETITAIYTSSLGRALETASHIRSFHPATPLHREPGLIEMDLGDFEGMETQQWAAKYPDFRAIWESNPAALSMPGGESLLQVQQRAIETLQRISESYGKKNTLLICSHNFVIVSLLCFASRIPLDDFRTVRQGTAALNILYKHGTDFQVELINDRSHLRKIFNG